MTQRKKFLNRMVTARGDSAAMAEDAAAQGEQYSATLAKLKGLSKNNKKKAHINSHKLEWQEEWRRLEGQQRRLEKDLGEAASTLAALGDFYDIEFDGCPRRELVSDVVRRHRQLKTTQAELTRRLAQSNVSSKVVGTLHDEEGGGRRDQGETFNSAEVREFGSNFAHYLLESRRWNAGCQRALEETEERLGGECEGLRRSVFRALAADLDHRQESSSGMEGGQRGKGGNECLADAVDSEVSAVLALLGELTVEATQAQSPSSPSTAVATLDNLVSAENTAVGLNKRVAVQL
eukprot:CAMPEP_0171750776 /NCGR_PEP_ID=MMETSP0991-20121206/41601_1 /TAXON_ID=483369 /ORGANISM="non described non described, Strain CCMP2098" /LENGTH=291 /DNA_ID=CAMNT_0012351791 /DNA_START=22 /DNA_END=893 /DNA_ORIENTATION=+